METFEICFKEISIRFVQCRAKTPENARKNFEKGRVSIDKSYDYGDFDKDVFVSIEKVLPGDER